ncbi:MAG: hypothetical protein ACOYU2_06100 [Nitrospirota bacterium]
MAKSRFIGLKVTDAELEQIKSVKLTKETLSQTVRRLLSKAIKDEREDLKGWQDLIVKLNNAALPKISDKLDTVLAVLNQTNQQNTNEPDEQIKKYLKRIALESIRVNIAVEELAKRRLGRSDFYQQFLDEIENRLEEKRQKGGQ